MFSIYYVILNDEATMNIAINNYDWKFSNSSKKTNSPNFLPTVKRFKLFKLV